MSYERNQKQGNQQRQEIAPRQLAVPSAMITQRGISPEQYTVLKQVIYPAAQDDVSIALAVDYCKARGLDIMKRPVHIVPVWDSKRNRTVDTIWPGINEPRTTAARTASYAGNDPIEYGAPISKKYRLKEWDNDARRKVDVGEVEVTFPEYATFTVYKMVQGTRCPFPVTVYWLETVQADKEGVPNSMWRKRPYGQIAKCAEAAALRAAFPEEIGDQYIPEEAHTLGQPGPILDVTPAAEKQVRQSRLDKLADELQGEHDDLPPQNAPRSVDGEILPPEVPDQPQNAPTARNDGPPAGDPRFTSSHDQRDIM